ncbi:hypothetical protein FQZ97_617470 [compost metagenome]
MTVGPPSTMGVAVLSDATMLTSTPPGRRSMVPAATTGASITIESPLPSLLARSSTLPLLRMPGSAPGAVGAPPACSTTPRPPFCERPVTSMLPPPVVTSCAPFSSRTPLSSVTPGADGSLLKL